MCFSRIKKGKFTICHAKESNEHHFCICNGLLSSAGYNRERKKPLYRGGTNASRIDRIVSVKALMDELTGKVPAAISVNSLCH